MILIFVPSSRFTEDILCVNSSTVNNNPISSKLENEIQEPLEKFPLFLDFQLPTSQHFFFFISFSHTDRKLFDENSFFIFKIFSSTFMNLN